MALVTSPQRPYSSGQTRYVLALHDPFSALCTIFPQKEKQSIECSKDACLVGAWIQRGLLLPFVLLASIFICQCAVAAECADLQLDGTTGSAAVSIAVHGGRHAVAQRSSANGREKPLQRPSGYFQPPQF